MECLLRVLCFQVRLRATKMLICIVDFLPSQVVLRTERDNARRLLGWKAYLGQRAMNGASTVNPMIPDATTAGSSREFFSGLWRQCKNHHLPMLSGTFQLLSNELHNPTHGNRPLVVVYLHEIRQERRKFVPAQEWTVG